MLCGTGNNFHILSTVNSVAFCSAEKPATELTTATELVIVATELTVGWNCNFHMLFWMKMSKFSTNKKNKSQNLNMFLQKRKRVCLNIEEKLWILNYKQENRQITNAKVALDFSAKFKRPITKSCVQKILGNAEKIQSILKAAPDLEVKKAKHLKLTTKYEFEKDLDAMLEVKYRSMNISYEIIKLAAEELQKTNKYEGIQEVQSLKFSCNWISAFAERNKIRKIVKVLSLS